MTRNPERPDYWPAARYSDPDGESSSQDASGRTPKGRGSGLPPKRSPRLRTDRILFFKNLKFWAILTGVVSGSLGFAAVALLVKPGALPNCPEIFWPMASASLRLYCAQVAADKQTPDDLLEAIALVNSLPPEHPLRSEINGSIEEWSLDLLRLAEQSFQDGQMDEALAVARKIPTNVTAYKLVQERIDRWQSIWSKGETFYKKAEKELRDLRWHDAFTSAVELTRLRNNYWAIAKYEELISLLHTTQVESRELDKATQLYKRGGLENLLASIKLAEPIGSASYVYKQAYELLANCAKQVIELAKGKLDNQDWQGVLDITSKIPASIKGGVEEEVKDLTDLAMAQSQADRGTANDIEAAISLAQELDTDRPLYDKAQQFIARWQLETQDVAHLQWARYLAKPGGVNELRVAIREAQKIPNSNPRGSEARSQLTTWRRRIETIEDSPYLNRASQVASFGNVSSLQEAIGEASKILPGRALYQSAQSKIGEWNRQLQRLQDQPYLDEAETQANIGNLSAAVAKASQITPGRVLHQEARNKIREWNSEIQRQQDRPYLDRAESLAFTGNLSSAITEAEQIRAGRVLYDEAQSKIRRWNSELQQQQDQPLLNQAEEQANAGDLSAAVAAAQQIPSGRALSGSARAKIRTWEREIQAQQNLQSANQSATTGTPEDLAAAIRAARQVPAASKLRAEAKDAINRWSTQLLAQAQERSASDIQGAIDIAKNIPPGTDAYASAQQQIQAWQKTLTP